MTTLAPKPERLSFDEAATLSTGATTAWQALFDHGHLEAGQRVLVQGAAGGVGLFAVQFARWKGAQVIGTTSRSNVDFVSSMGAEVVDYTATPVEKVVHDVDLVFDTVGGETLNSSVEVLKRGGTRTRRCRNEQHHETSRIDATRSADDDHDRSDSNWPVTSFLSKKYTTPNNSNVYEIQ